MTYYRKEFLHLLAPTPRDIGAIVALPNDADFKICTQNFGSRYFLKLPKRSHLIHIMIRRTMLGQSRAFYVRTHYLPKASSIASHLPPLRIRSLQERLGSRYYSSADTPGEGVNPHGAAAEASQSQVEDIDPIKKDLELKNKEIIDLKVRPTCKEIHRFICSRYLTKSVPIG